MFSGLTHLTDLSTDSRFATLLGYTPEELDGPLVFNRIRASGKLPEDLEHVPADPMTLDVCDALTLPVESLLYQSGYLTIKEVVPAPEQTPEEAERDPKTESYFLGPPNLKVEKDGV